jgi:CheY-like chemotaxis protein
MKKVLVCDDDKDILYIMTFTLTGMDWEVVTSEDCINMIEKVAEHQPAVIIMDNGIPDIGGVKTIQLLKSHALYKKIPVILYTGSDTAPNLAKEAGADFYAVKPIYITKLEKMMEDAYQLFLQSSIQNLDQSDIASA